MTTLELQLEQTRAELRRLSSAVEQLVATTPQRTKQWLEPRELAQLLGISTRTLALWRADGRFRPISIRKQGRGYQFHVLFLFYAASVAHRSIGKLFSDQ